MSYETDKLKSGLKGRYFAWVGQNASTGSAHPITGRYSMYGRYCSFSNKADRDEFVADFYDCNGNEFAVAGGIKKMRQYSLGNSMIDFLENLHYSIEV